MRLGFFAIMSMTSSQVTSTSLYKFNSINPFNLSSPVLLRRYVFNLRRQEKDRSLVATETGRVAPICKNVCIDGYNAELQLLRVSINVLGRLSFDIFKQCLKQQCILCFNIDYKKYFYV